MLEKVQVRRGFVRCLTRTRARTSNQWLRSGAERDRGAQQDLDRLIGLLHTTAEPLADVRASCATRRKFASRSSRNQLRSRVCQASCPLFVWFWTARSASSHLAKVRSIAEACGTSTVMAANKAYIKRMPILPCRSVLATPNNKPPTTMHFG